MLASTDLWLKGMGAALLKQIKSASNKGIQHYQHRFYATSWQDNTGVRGYLT
jgi:hypothetical protein